MIGSLGEHGNTHSSERMKSGKSFLSKEEKELGAVKMRGEGEALEKCEQDKAKAEKDGSWYFSPSVNSTEKNVLRKIEEKITQLLH